MTWEELTLTNILDLKYGKGLPERERIDGDFPVYGSSGITGWHKEALVKGPGIIIGRKGTIGSVHFENNDFFPIDTVYYVEEDKTKVDLRFTYYLLKTLQLNKLNTDAAVPGLNRNNALRVKCKVPSLKKQSKVVEILSGYDDLIENNNRRIELLEELARLLYREWFVDFRFPGYEHVEVIDGLPKGWENDKISNTCTKITDGTHDSPKPVDEGYYLVTGKHITNGFIDFGKCYFISEKDHKEVIARSKPEKGDILFSNIGTLGSTVYVDQDFEYSIKNIALFKPKNMYLSYYLYLFLNSNRTIESFMSQSSGTSQKFLSLNFLRNVDITVPDKSILKEFFSIIDPIMKQRSLLYNYNSALIKARDILLPKLMNGEIEV